MITLADAAMKAEELVIPPPQPRLAPYPEIVGVLLGILAASVLLVVANKMDRTHGELTISLLVVLGYLAAMIFCLFFTVPQDATTAAIIGGLSTAFGMVMTRWVAGRKGDGDGPH
jgi:hypothetical protein